MRGELLEAKGYEGNASQLCKGYNLQGKVTYSATPLARNKKVLEIGAGDIRHMKYWKNKPKFYSLADISKDMMKFAEQRLQNKNIPFDSILLNRDEKLPLNDNSIDIIISFYSLEHLFPLSNYLKEMKRVLKKGGTLIGAIPSEGGVAWGLGRMITSRRWFKKNTSIDPDKIICWEHPNFADEIISSLDNDFCKKKLKWYPFRLPSVDMNLIIQFNYTNQK